MNDALTLVHTLSHSFSQAFAQCFAAEVHLHCRETRTARERAEAALALCSEQGFPHWLAVSTILWGWTLTEQGQGREGLTQIQQGLVAYQATGAKLQLPYFLSLLAEAYGKTGRVEEGLTALAEALVTVDKTGERFYEAELYRLKGELLLQQESQKSKGKGQKSKIETDP